MVLIFLILALGLTQSSDPPLVVKYSKEIRKTIKKEFGTTAYNLQEDVSNNSLANIYIADRHVGTLLVTEVAACHLGGCVPNYNQAEELCSKEVALGSEYFDVLVLLSPELTVQKIKILNYFSDYGYEVTSKNYLKKFKGKKVCEFSSATDGIDAISGATISSMALEGLLGQLCN